MSEKQTIILIDSIHNKKIVAGDIDSSKANENIIDNDKTYINKENHLGKNELLETRDPPTHREILHTAHQIAVIFDDDVNFSFYYKVVKDLGPLTATRLLHETQDDMLVGLKSGSRIYNPAALFNWKVQNFRKNPKKI